MPETTTQQKARTTPSHSELSSEIFAFEECLSYFERTGQRLYGKHFKITKEDHELIFKLLTYFTGDDKNATRYKIDLKKGLLLSGPIGCGKTSLMTIIMYSLQDQRRFGLVSTRKIAHDFMKEGYASLDRYTQPRWQSGTTRFPIFCFDDLGVEQSLKYYGNELNIMAEILLFRYDHFIQNGLLTHLTTNLNADEIEKLYGNRVRSRMREMFNLVSFGKDVQDKRR